MSKEEFLTGLRKSLSSTGSLRLTEENINYYSSYIDEEIRKGRTEEEVLSELGDPRLIANSIKEAEGIEDDFSVLREENTGNQSQSFEREDFRESKNFRMYRFNTGSGKWVFLALLAVIILILLLITAVAVKLFVFLSPVLIPILMIMLVFSLMNFLGGKK